MSGLAGISGGGADGFGSGGGLLGIGFGCGIGSGFWFGILGICWPGNCPFCCIANRDLAILDDTDGRLVNKCDKSGAGDKTVDDDEDSLSLLSSESSSDSASMYSASGMFDTHQLIDRFKWK